MSTITLTYSDICENHTGMERIGRLTNQGVSCQSLQEIAEKYPKNCEHILLHSNSNFPEASILIIRNGIDLLTGDRKFLTNLYTEQQSLEPNRHVFL